MKEGCGGGGRDKDFAADGQGRYIYADDERGAGAVKTSKITSTSRWVEAEMKVEQTISGEGGGGEGATHAFCEGTSGERVAAWGEAERLGGRGIVIT